MLDKMEKKDNNFFVGCYSYLYRSKLYHCVQKEKERNLPEF